MRAQASGVGSWGNCLYTRLNIIRYINVEKEGTINSGNFREFFRRGKSDRP
jgi:hypothetical protein